MKISKEKRKDIKRKRKISKTYTKECRKYALKRKKIETMEEWQLNEKNDTKIAEWQNPDKKSLLSKT